MRLSLFLNLVANILTVAVVSVVLVQSAPPTDSQTISSVGLRGWGGLARVAKGAASSRKPGPMTRTMGNSSRARHLRQARTKTKAKATQDTPTKADTFAAEFEERMKSVKIKPTKSKEEKSGRRRHFLPSFSPEDKDGMLASSGRLQPRKEHQTREVEKEIAQKHRSRSKEEKKEKKGKEENRKKKKETKEEKGNKKKKEKDEERWAFPKHANRSEWLPPSPVTSTQELTLAQTEDPSLKPSASPVTSAPTTSTPTSATPHENDPTTSPSLYPTWSPTKLPTLDNEDETIPSCPPEYNPSYAGYAAGDAAEMDSHIFVCQSGPYEPYCSIGELDPAWNETVQEWWQESWYHIGSCQLVIQAMTEEAVEGGTITYPMTTSTNPTEATYSPDELYDKEDWSNLPEEINHAMKDLGYTEEIWNEGSVASTDDLDWGELSEEEQGAAAVVGYTEQLWMSEQERGTALESTSAGAQVATLDTATTGNAAAKLTEAVVAIATAPITIPAKATAIATATATTTSTTVTTTTVPPATTTASTISTATTKQSTTPPTTLPPEKKLNTETIDSISNTPTGYPTYMPTQSWPACPPHFDSIAIYQTGDLAEVGEHAFQCNTGAYEKYCNIPDWDSSLLEADENAKVLWEGAWVHIEPCTLGG